MTTEQQRQRLRLDLGFAADDIVSLPDAVIDDIFEQSGELYTDEVAIAVNARVIALRRLLIQAANEVDYTQNRTSEKASQRYQHLTKELDRWQGLLDQSVSMTEGGAVRSGKPTRTPPRVREYPEGFIW